MQRLVLASDAKDVKQSDTSIFEALAQSQPAFKSVGRLLVRKESVKDLPGDEWQCQYQASGVYLGNGLVITAAHAVPDFVKDDAYLNFITKPWFFVIYNEDGTVQLARVQKAIRHPEYLREVAKVDSASIKLFTPPALIARDIAILQLDRDLNVKTQFEIDYEEFSSKTKSNLVAVGFPGSFGRRSQDAKAEPVHAISMFDPEKSYWDSLKKLAIKVNSVHLAEGGLVSMVGGKVLPYNGSFKAVPYDPLDNGCFAGMSGGPLVADNKFVGLHVCLDGHGGYVRQVGQGDYFVPLFRHKKWIEDVVQHLQKSRPDIRSGMSSYYEAYTAYIESRRQLQSDTLKAQFGNKLPSGPVSLGSWGMWSNGRKIEDQEEPAVMANSFRYR